MKTTSVKIKITAWLTLLMALLSALMLVFLLAISQSVVTQTASRQLSQTLRANAAQLSLDGGKPVLGENFQFYQNGVYTLVYNSHEALLAGQVPVSFTAQEPFQKNVTRTVDSGSTRYLVLDLWSPSGWENGLWVRGLMEVPEYGQTSRNLLILAGASLPLFILLAAIGGYWIVRRAFRPLDTINSTAAAINEARDLSRRIGLPPGKDEFTQLAHNFDRLFERLERSFEAEKQFTADASHELRTPISIIKGACEYAQTYEETPEERQETLDMIHRQATKMSHLVNQLLSMTRLEQGTELPGIQSVDLGGMAQQLLEEGGYDLGRVKPHLPTGIMVEGDPALLSRLLRNLVDNAFKYGKEDGFVWVSVRQTPEETLLQVRDEGDGIPAEHQEKIWNRFYQVDPSRSEELGGAGLGLALVQQIARLHGGYMSLDSVAGGGSTFTLHLPRTKNNV